jgi:hypothetical protein
MSTRTIGLGRQVAYFGKAGDAPAIDQHHRPAAAASAPAARLGAQRLDQLGDVAGAISADVARTEHDLGRDVAQDGAARAAAGDDDLGFLGREFRVGRFGGRLRRLVSLHWRLR